MDLIRFAAVDVATFEQLCAEGLEGVMSSGERRRVLAGIGSGRWGDVALAAPRTAPTISVALPCGADDLQTSRSRNTSSCEAGVSILRFHVDRQVTLVSLRLAPNASGAETATMCGCAAGGAARFFAEVAADGARELRVQPPCVLAPLVEYCVKFTDRDVTPNSGRAAPPRHRDRQYRVRWGPRHPYATRWLSLVLHDNVYQPKIHSICFTPHP